MIECRPKGRLLSGKLCRGSKLWSSALVANHHKPESHRLRIAIRSAGECGDRNFLPVVENAKVLLLEVPNVQSTLGILADDVDQHQGRLHSNCGGLWYCTVF